MGQVPDTGGRSAALRTAAFATLFVVATAAGRSTVMEGSAQSLVWPSAGVAVVWLAAQHRAPRRWPDALALAGISMASSLATCTSVTVAGTATVATLVQVWVFLQVLGRLCPELWGVGGSEPLGQVRHLWRLLIAAACAALSGALAGPVAASLITGEWSPLDTAVWAARTAASVILIGTVGLRLGHLVTTPGYLAALVNGQATVSTSGDERPSPHFGASPSGPSGGVPLPNVQGLASLAGRWLATVGKPALAGLIRCRKRATDQERARRAEQGRCFRRTAEYAAVLAVSTVAYIVAFPADHNLPLGFPLLAATVWAGLRCGTTFVVLHTLFFGSVAILFTLHGSGPFAKIESEDARALVAQLFVVMVSVVGMALALSRDERDALLHRLADAEDAALAQARLLTTIVDSMNDGLAVVDADGRFAMRNPAVRRLLGGITAIEPGHFTFYHPDGTPMRHEELAHVRALAGDEVRGMDVLVRNAGVPGGRMLSVSATPLHDAEGGRVVMVCHDVTAERRHRDELTSFAGVVAHDLLAPLAVVEGWAETLGDAVRDSSGDPELTRLGSGVARIERAAARMREFIHALLAHTTARDAAMDLRPVPLNDLVRDITAIRGDLPTGGSDVSIPRFHFGELLDVLADPALLRQVLENLIGNAIKYTRPGTTPDITVGSVVARPGWIRVEVADRGVGVPAGQRLSVFDEFHRAHADEGFSGSGLGLAICKKIVERHGGTIGVDANPGGGSVFYFTLPKPTRPAAARAKSRVAGQRTAPTTEHALSPATNRDAKHALDPTTGQGAEHALDPATGQGAEHAPGHGAAAKASEQATEHATEHATGPNQRPRLAVS